MQCQMYDCDWFKLLMSINDNELLEHYAIIQQRQMHDCVQYYSCNLFTCLDSSIVLYISPKIIWERQWFQS